MEKPELTSQGVEQKVRELYNLQEGLLLKEIELIKADVKTWIDTNFLLNTKEYTYLQYMDPTTTDMISGEVALGLSGGIPILFEKDEEPEDYGSKRINCIRRVVYDPNGPGNPKGDLYIKIFYQL